MKLVYRRAVVPFCYVHVSYTGNHVHLDRASGLDARHNNVDIDHESSYSACIQFEFQFLTLANEYGMEFCYNVIRVHFCVYDPAAVKIHKCPQRIYEVE